MLSIFKRGEMHVKIGPWLRIPCIRMTHSFVSTEILQKAALDKQNEWENQLIKDLHHSSPDDCTVGGGMCRGSGDFRVCRYLFISHFQWRAMKNDGGKMVAQDPKRPGGIYPRLRDCLSCQHCAYLVKSKRKITNDFFFSRRIFG